MKKWRISRRSIFEDKHFASNGVFSDHKDHPNRPGYLRFFVDSEDGVAIEAPGNLNLDADFLLGQDIEFGDPDHDNKILGLDKFSEQSPAYSQLSMDSETDNSHSTTDNSRDDEGRASQSEPSFPPYLSCRGCGQLRDEPLGPGIDLVGPYCLRCCKASREAKSPDFCSPFGRHQRDSSWCAFAF
ncbi:hypothetical protein KUCAC02_019884 [Chaenocephalus aceratus]|uniref:Uncharacterized protein n=1 Tax=Chaenocephalus aceratus TaxID=36190 RepID=A0ACB9VPU8_CHAAC|nr:hypothetical protein KUCAC02_019884 [Chaenocephalus aceratus]